MYKRQPNIGIPSGVPGLTPADAEMNSASHKIGKISFALATIWEIASPVTVLLKIPSSRVAADNIVPSFCGTKL